MENQTPSDLNFDLNRALLAWKAELASEPGVSVENVRELQAHLLENISALQRRGLNDQEAFQKARQQLGSMSKIPARVYPLILSESGVTAFLAHYRRIHSGGVLFSQDADDASRALGR